LIRSDPRAADLYLYTLGCFRVCIFCRGLFPFSFNFCPFDALFPSRRSEEECFKFRHVRLVVNFWLSSFLWISNASLCPVSGSRSPGHTSRASSPSDVGLFCLSLLRCNSLRPGPHPPLIQSVFFRGAFSSPAWTPISFARSLFQLLLDSLCLTFTLFVLLSRFFCYPNLEHPLALKDEILFFLPCLLSILLPAPRLSGPLPAARPLRGGSSQVSPNHRSLPSRFYPFFPPRFLSPPPPRPF